MALNNRKLVCGLHEFDRKKFTKDDGGLCSHKALQKVQSLRMVVLTRMQGPHHE